MPSISRRTVLGTLGVLPGAVSPGCLDSNPRTDYQEEAEPLAFETLELRECHGEIISDGLCSEDGRSLDHEEGYGAELYGFVLHTRGDTERVRAHLDAARIVGGTLEAEYDTPGRFIDWTNFDEEYVLFLQSFHRRSPPVFRVEGVGSRSDDEIYAAVYMEEGALEGGAFMTTLVRVSDRRQPEDLAIELTYNDTRGEDDSDTRHGSYAN